ncbi:hypothetical protein BGZ54_005110, partial [Gamsiella multidivaricata]
DVLPHRITFTIGGTDYYSTEIRNVAKIRQDVEDLWGCGPEQIKVDLGQSCVLRAIAILLKNARNMGARDITVREQGDSDTDVDIQDPYEGPTLAPGDYDTDVDMEDLCKSPTPAPAPTLGFAPATYYNLAVKQKAIYQPTFKHRCWMEGQKSVVPDGIESTSDIETKLPSQRSGGVSLAIYLTELEKVQGRLNEFYNGNNRLMKHKWDVIMARDEDSQSVYSMCLAGRSTGREMKSTRLLLRSVWASFDQDETFIFLYFVQK